MKIKKWKIWICASLDDKTGQYWWNETIYEHKKKENIISIIREKIDLGIEKLKTISKNDLKAIKY